MEKIHHSLASRVEFQLPHDSPWLWEMGGKFNRTVKHTSEKGLECSPCHIIIYLMQHTHPIEGGEMQVW